jgi:Tfp pilus assembly protein PilW
MLTGSRRGERGFTLPDMLVGMTLAIIAGAGAVTFVRSQSLALRVQAGQADLNDSSRGGVELMAREIRLAGYWPCGMSATAPCPGGCPLQGGSGRGIVTGATSTLIRIQADLDGNGAISTASAATEDLTFQYDAANTKVTRTAGTAGGASTSDLTTDVAAGAFAFRYYNGSTGAEIVPGGGGLTAAEAAAINRVAIRLEPTKTADARITTQAKASLWTNVFLDNYGKCR